MDLYIQLALLGFGAGAIYAGLALGLVLAYQGSGVVNFGHGAMAMYAAYVFHILRTDGDLVFPMIVLPDRIPLGDPMGTWPAFVLAILMSMALGYLVHLLVFHPLRTAPLLAKVVASVGLMLVLQGLALLQFGPSNVVVGPILPAGSQVDLPFVSATVSKDRLWMGAIALAATLVLWAMYKFTRFGLATRAAAKEEEGAVLLGYAPSRLAAGNWVLSAAVAGGLGILASNITGINTTNFILFIIPALACALIGRLESFPIAAAAGLALGMIDAVMPKMASESWFPDWLPFQAAQKGLPFVLIVLVLVAGGTSLPSRGTLDKQRQARALMPVNIGRWTATLLPLAVLACLVLPRAMRLGLYFSLASAIILLSVVILTGYLGQVSLAQAVFAGASGFGMAKLASNGVPFPFSLLLGALAATVVGVIMALPALRIRGAQLAVVTVAAGVAVEEFVFKNKTFTGDTGAQLVDPPTLFGINLGSNVGQDFNRWEFGVFLSIVLALICIGVSNIRRGGTGRRMLAIRSNEMAAAAAGINVMQTKLLVFAMSSFVAGVGGSMLAYQRGAISSTSFSVFVSLTLLAFAYLGGIASVSGALVGSLLVPGGILFVVLGDYILDIEALDAYQVMVGGMALVLTAIMNPQGITGKVAEDIEKKRRQHEAASETAEPTMLGALS